MYCPGCGKTAESNFCPNCGADLRNIVVSKASTGVEAEDYADYRRFYPNKIEAIKALRAATGMSLAEAKGIIDKLFGADVIPPKPVFKHSEEWKVASVAVASGSQYTDIDSVDVFYCANQYYPDKTKAVHALLQMGVRGVEARMAIDDAFLKIEGSRKYSEKSARQKKAQNVAKVVGKGVGTAALIGGYGAFRIIAGLVKPYMRKRK